jgi:hypothetical protein
MMTVVTMMAMVTVVAMMPMVAVVAVVSKNRQFFLHTCRWRQIACKYLTGIDATSCDPFYSRNFHGDCLHRSLG